ncbi:Protein of unknown function, partial [Gryllus bimaculatus]
MDFQPQRRVSRLHRHRRVRPRERPLGPLRPQRALHQQPGQLLLPVSARLLRQPADPLP